MQYLKVNSQRKVYQPGGMLWNLSFQDKKMVKGKKKRSNISIFLYGSI